MEVGPRVDGASFGFGINDDGGAHGPMMTNLPVCKVHDHVHSLLLKLRFAVCRFPGQGEGKRKEKDQVISGVSTGSNICLDPFCPVPRSCNSASSSRYWYRRLAISTPVQPLSSKWVLWAVVPGALAERVTGRKHLNQERMENRFYCGGNGRPQRTAVRSVV